LWPEGPFAPVAPLAPRIVPVDPEAPTVPVAPTEPVAPVAPDTPAAKATPGIAVRARLSAAPAMPSDTLVNFIGFPTFLDVAPERAIRTFGNLDRSCERARKELLARR
jgi:hypothetical protein